MHIQDGVDKCHRCLEYIHVQVYVHFAVEQSNLLQGFIAVLLPIASLLQIKKFIVICNALEHLQYEDYGDCVTEEIGVFGEIFSFHSVL